MQENTTIQTIATVTATTAAQNLLNTTPASVRDALSAQFLTRLEEELQSELQATIHSRLLWSQQSVQLELAEQQRLQALKTATPEPLQPEPAPQRLVPVSRPATERHMPKSKRVIEPQKAPIPSPEPDAVVSEAEATVAVPVPAPAVEHSQKESNPAPPTQGSQLNLPVLPEPDPFKPGRRRRRASQASGRILRGSTTSTCRTSNPATLKPSLADGVGARQQWLDSKTGEPLASRDH